MNDGKHHIGNNEDEECERQDACDGVKVDKVCIDLRMHTPTKYSHSGLRIPKGMLSYSCLWIDERVIGKKALISVEFINRCTA